MRSLADIGRSLMFSLGGSVRPISCQLPSIPNNWDMHTHDYAYRLVTLSIIQCITTAPPPLNHTPSHQLHPLPSTTPPPLNRTPSPQPHPLPSTAPPPLNRTPSPQPHPLPSTTPPPLNRTPSPQPHPLPSAAPPPLSLHVHMMCGVCSFPSSVTFFLQESSKWVMSCWR